jgi:uncharacterized protein (TIGR03118 family)
MLFMKSTIVRSCHPYNSSISLLLLALLIFMQSCKKEIRETPQPITVAGKAPKTLKDFTEVNLVGSDQEYNPARIDPLLVNGWGIAFSPTGTVWISAEGAGVSTVYNKEGVQVLPAVMIPSATSSTGGHPTGQVFNGGAGFRLSNGNPARFIFAGADGTISGWNGGPSASLVINDAPDAAYLGITIATSGPDKFLYVANFKEGSIDVYDTAWNEISMPFNDPTLPSGYAPFNVQNIGNMLYVMYAKVGADGEEEVGPGNGYVDIYNPDGSFSKRLVSRGQLNAPWGIAEAPATFWGDDGVTGLILVGNFGDGHINVYNANGDYMGQLRSSGNPIVIEGLWALMFPPATATAINPNRLYFAAGPDDETEGLFGYIIK